MQFLFFAAQYLPTVGGVERYTYNLCRELTKMGHHCTVVTSALPNLLAEEESEGIKIFRLPSHLFMNGRFPVIKGGRELKTAAEPIWRKRYDLAVINTRFYPLSIYAAKECRRRKIKSIIIEHGTKHLALDSKFLDFFGNLYEHLAMKWIRRYCDNFYGVSAACNDWLRHFHVAAKGVLYNAIDVEEVQKIAGDALYDARNSFSLTENVKLAVFSGRFIREKGIAELLDGFAAFYETNPDNALIMAGEGPLFETAKKRRQPGVYFAGMLSYENSLALLRQADVFVLPTYSEGFSTVILEAAALGRCIVTTPTGGSPELLYRPESGILLEEISPEAIAAALKRALFDSAFRETAGRLVKERVEQEFTWRKTAEKLVATAAKK